MSVKTAAALEALERQACDLLVTESNMPGARDSRGATLMRTAVVSSGGLVALLVGLTLPAAGRTVAPSPVTALRHELVVIDAGVDLPLEDLARDEAAGRRRSTLVLREEDDGIRAVERHLASHGAVDAVHIVTHGASGLVELGRTRLTPASLAGHAEGLAAWRRFLRPGADVAIYGCDVARDDSGRRFVRDLARLLGADVAASVDRTGSARAGGDWRLEFGVGDVEARVPFTRSALRTWSGLLPIVSFQQGTSGYTGTQDAYLDEQFPGTAFGGAAIVSVENNPGQRQHGLIRFDSIFGAGAGQIPLGSVINSASLTVNVTNTSAAGAQIRLHRMLVTWSEGSTWTSMTGGIQTNDVEARLAFDAQVASPASLGSQVITGLGATLQAWSSGATVHGWAFISNSTDGWDFRSSEDGTVSTRPLLTVDYTAPTGGISGTVFEDVQYGGGAGRSLVASSGVGRSGARVELFDSGGNFLAFAPSGVGGVYAFAALAAGSYTVRVVNSTVTSSRPGAVGGLLPVQSFRTDANSGTAVADVDRVGGEDPTKEDAGNGSTTLAALTTATTTAQSVAPVTVAAANVSGVDFGFNFDTIVSTRAAGQGSLDQFLLNSNALGNVGLAQSGLTAGVEHSLFMIPGGAAVPGLRAGLTNQLTAGRALITLTGLLPTISGANGAATAVDGTTQTARVGNTNTAVLGTGGTVGVDGLTLGQVAGPEVEIRDGAGLAVGLRIQGNSARVRGLAMLGFGATNGEAAVRVEGGATSALIENNVLGSTALVFADPGAALRNYEGVDADGATGGTIRDNLLVFGTRRGIFLQNGSTGWTVSGNEIRDNGLGDPDGDGISLNLGTGTFTGNLIAGSSSQGFVVTDATGNTFTNNTVSGNGVGTTSTVAQSAGIALRSTASTTLIDRNVVRANYGAGLAANNGSTGTRLTRNSFADNGTIVARNSNPATGQIGIDLNSPSDNSNLGTAPFFTLNDSGDGDAGGNGLLNFPILVSATLSGGNLSLQGFARPGSVIELFVASPDPTGFGEGETYKITLTEGGTGAGGDDPYADTDATSGSYGPGAINGIAQGTDTTNRFAFTFPVPAGIVAGTRLTATATLVGATSEFGGNVTVVALGSVSGTVFEDVQYGGGAGRSLVASSGVGRNGARVELFDSGGNFLAFAPSGVGGVYAFTGLAAGSYTVRVVNSTVTSSRPGAVGGLLPVQSFRTNASSGTAVADVDRVGGEDPVKIDAGNGSTTLAALTTATTTAQSVAPVTVAAANVSGVDFGFNFDTIVSTRAAGQGSLDQFLRNSNALGNAGLAQSGLTAGVEHSLFMIPGGAAVPGLRAGLTNQLTAGRALITLTGLLPAIFGANGAATAVDGTTQTVRVGNTNPVTLGIGGTVGTGADAVAGTADEPALPQVAGPEVQLVDGAGLLVGLDVQASDVTVRGIAIFGFGSAINNGNVRVGLDATTNYTGTLLEDNVIGASAGAFTDPDLTVPGSGTAGSNVAILGADGGTIRRNLVGYAGSVGVTLGLGADGWTIRENEVRRNGLDAARLDGVGLTVSSSAGIVTGNLLIDNQGAGLDFFTSFGGHTVENNTIEQNGWGGVETTGVRMFGQNSTIRHNWIHDNQGSGVLAVVDDVAFPETPAIRKRITRNQFGDNGSNAIDLQTTLDVVAPGDGITTNDGTLLGDSSVPNVCGTVASHGNEGLDTPLLDVVLLAGTTLSVVGRACPNSTVEIYRSVAGAGDTLAATNYGEGVEYLGQATAAPATGVFSFSGPVGFGVGTEVSAIAIDTTNNTSEFSPAVAAAPLEIVKHAFETDGTPIPDGILLPRGTLVEFVLYVNNPGAAALDVTLRDVLDPTFAYVAGSLRFDGTTPACAAATCTPAEEATIFAAADGGAPGTDAVDGDVVGFVAATVEAGNQYVGNAQLNVPAGKVWAVVFTVRMQ